VSLSVDGNGTLFDPPTERTDMTGRYGDLDYSTLAKRGTILGFGLFALGALGELASHALGLQLTAWEAALLFDAEVVGVALFLLSPLVFGVVLPLTE
jgi:hypothetical protein